MIMIPMTMLMMIIMMLMMIDVGDQAAKAPASISIMERSLFSERYCFVQVISILLAPPGALYAMITILAPNQHYMQFRTTQSTLWASALSEITQSTHRDYSENTQRTLTSLAEHKLTNRQN